MSLNQLTFGRVPSKHIDGMGFDQMWINRVKVFPDQGIEPTFRKTKKHKVT